MILGLVGNPTKPALKEVLPAYIAWLDGKKVKYVLSDEFSKIPELQNRDLISPAKVMDSCNVVLSFGGDGTFLNTVRLLHGRETPVLGVNLGGLGYLTEVGSDDLRRCTMDLLDKKWDIERRVVLEATVEGQENKNRWFALNDVVIDKGGYARMIHLHTSIDGRYLSTFRADGLIISTPTGSTAYSLSAGGPIMEPRMGAVLIVPNNPHSLTNRPLVISDDRTVRVEAHSPQHKVVVSVDGHIACEPSSGTAIIVKRADFTACVVNLKGRYFYDVLRQKLGWGN